MLDLYNLCCLIFIISSTDCFYNQQKKKKKCYKKGKQGLQSVKPGGLRRWCQSFLLKLGQIGEVCFACKTSATKAPSMANSPTGTASRAWDQFVWQWGRRHCGQRDAWEEAQPFFCVYWSIQCCSWNAEKPHYVNFQSLGKMTSYSQRVSTFFSLQHISHPESMVAF